MDKAIVLASGGLDSCVTIAYAIKDGYDVSLLHINYGQRTQKREDKAFDDIADFYNIKNKMTVNIDYLKNIGGSSLTDFYMKVEENTTPSSDRATQGDIPSTYVPFRNANMISIAVSWAEVIGAKKIYIGAVEEDSSGYPDCREIFYEKFNDLLKVALSPKSNVEIVTPVIKFRKKDIVKKGLELNAPLHLTWSCYQNEDIACGVCESCKLRLKGFEFAGEKDPIPYK